MHIRFFIVVLLTIPFHFVSAKPELSESALQKLQNIIKRAHPNQVKKALNNNTLSLKEGIVLLTSCVSSPTKKRANKRKVIREVLQKIPEHKQKELNTTLLNAGLYKSVELIEPLLDYGTIPTAAFFESFLITPNSKVPTPIKLRFLVTLIRTPWHIPEPKNHQLLQHKALLAMVHNKQTSHLKKTLLPELYQASHTHKTSDFLRLVAKTPLHYHEKIIEEAAHITTVRKMQTIKKIFATSTNDAQATVESLLNILITAAQNAEREGLINNTIPDGYTEKLLRNLQCIDPTSYTSKKTTITCSTYNHLYHDAKNYFTYRLKSYYT